MYVCILCKNAFVYVYICMYVCMYQCIQASIYLRICLYMSTNVVVEGFLIFNFFFNS